MRGIDMGEDYTITKMMVCNNLCGATAQSGFVKYKHWHRELEFILIVQGRLSIDVEQTMYELRERDMMVISSGTIHTFDTVEPGSRIWVARIFEDEIATYDKDRLYQLYQDTLVVHATDTMSNLFHDIVTANHDSLNELYIHAKAAELSIEIMDAPECIRQSIATTPAEDTEKITQMNAYLETNITQNITLSTLADYLGFSATYFSKFIKSKTSLNFTDYLNQIRVRKADEFLRSTDCSMTEVAYKSGFNSIQTFNRVFKKARGVSPGTFRKSLHRQNKSLS